MISNYDLINLGFNPKYKGFSLLREAVNLKIADIGLSANDIYRKLNPEHPSTVEKNIRVCIVGSNVKSKHVTLSVPKTIENLAKYANGGNEMSISPRVKFAKVSFKQFKKDVLDCGFKFNDGELMDFWKSIRLPHRATTGSAGYDFYAPFDLKFQLGTSLKFPTGIKCYMDGDVVLLLAPRSSLGFKHRWGLDNYLGVVDCDYMMAKNEGHMHCKAHYCNENLDELVIKQGEAYMQGIFVPFIKTVDDDTDGVRIGGFGSTNGSSR